MKDELQFCTACGTKLSDVAPGGVCECGATLKPGNSFCTVCGRKIAASSSTQQSTPPRPRFIETVRVCPKCGTKLREGLKFCTKCGFELNSTSSTTVNSRADGSSWIKCTYCGASVKVGNKFCTKCGKELRQASDPPLTDSTPSYHTPPIIDGGLKGNGERSMYEWFRQPSNDLMADWQSAELNNSTTSPQDDPADYPGKPKWRDDVVNAEQDAKEETTFEKEPITQKEKSDEITSDADQEEIVDNSSRLDSEDTADRCPKCGVNWNPGQKFCIMCGYSLTIEEKDSQPEVTESLQSDGCTQELTQKLEDVEDEEEMGATSE